MKSEHLFAETEIKDEHLFAETEIKGEHLFADVGDRNWGQTREPEGTKKAG